MALWTVNEMIMVRGADCGGDGEGLNYPPLVNRQRIFGSCVGGDCLEKTGEWRERVWEYSCV